MEILNNSNFKDFINKDYVLVDFYADWCGPCKMMHPVLEQITDIDVAKVNVDESQDLAREYGVMSIPTLILFKKGVAISTKVGFNSREQLDSWIKEN